MTNETKITTYKAFDKNLVCNPDGKPFQYAIGGTYELDGPVVVCKTGFHAVKYPLDMFGYYPPAGSRFAETTQSGVLATHSQDTKIASAKITINCELFIPDIVKRAIQWVLDQTTPSNAKHSDGDRSASSATGDRSASSATGDRSASSATGDRSASSATGDLSASSATGDLSASSATGDLSASSATGYRSASSATGYQSASSATGYQSASSATGDRSASSATGDLSASSATGDLSASSATGYQSVAMNSGLEGRAMGIKGNALFLVYRDPDSYEIMHAWSGIVGRDGIEPEVWYMLGADGKPMVVQK